MREVRHFEATPLGSACFALLIGGAIAAPAGGQQADLALADTPRGGASATSETPTFYGEVLAILQENCQACHQPAGLNMGGMVAPMSLVTYEETRPWAPLMAQAVAEGRMPPWSAAPVHQGTFKDERILDEEEKAAIIAWAEGGAPAGDPADAPPPPAFLARVQTSASGWFLGEPDLILAFAEPYCLTDDDEDVYVNLPVEITREMLSEDRWLQSVEYHNGPGVHHILSSVAALVPGMAPAEYEEGRGRLFRAGPRQVLFNMHFNKTPGPGTAFCTNIQAGITFKEPGEVIRYVTSGADLMMRGIRIPPGAESYASSMVHEFDEDVEILSFVPHMHLRGKAALYELVHPDGRLETLLHVPNYDFNWQHTYEFREPVLATAGSKLRFTLWWDNSANNPFNPDPTAEVRWGLPTSAEMSQGYMSYRRLQELHLVVGDPIPADFLEPADPADGAQTAPTATDR